MLAGQVVGGLLLFFGFIWGITGNYIGCAVGVALGLGCFVLPPFFGKLEVVE